jgi:predicted DNA-binding transcriptional regulator AlpA
MSEPPAITPHRLLRTNEAAQWLGLSGRTLEKHRTYGTGPSYRKIGGRVVYALSDLQTWSDRGCRSSTSELRRERVHPARRLPSEPNAGALR